jgi:glycosyltransferase involved in cell wall biosynthesis
LSRSLSANGWEVTAIVARGGESPPAGVRAITVAIDWPLRWAARTPLRLREEWLGVVTNIGFDLMCARRLPQCDVFYAYSMASLRSLTTARRRGALTVLHAATTYVPRLRQVLDAECRRLGVGNHAVSPWLARRAVREYTEADVIRVQSSLVRESLLEAGIPAAKITLIPPAVDLEAFTPAARQDNEEFTVCFVGAFSVRKGFHHVLAAWELVADGASRLLLHGGYGDRWGRALEAKASSRRDVTLRFGGPPHPTYAAADVCVVPSIEDGFCYVVLEAMACGLPVVISDQVGARDLVDDGVEGYVVPAGDPGALRDRIDHLRADSALRRWMGDAARRRAEAHTFAAEGRALSAALEEARVGRRGAPVAVAR